MASVRPMNPRKRRIGLSMAVAATPLLTSVVVLVQASPFRQHRVPVSRRSVAYPHTIEQRQRDLSSKFCYQGPSHDKSHAKTRHLEVTSGDPQHVVWSFVADANTEHPLADASSDMAENNDSNPQESSRRVQVTDKFVEDSTSATLQEEGEADNAEHVLGMDEAPEIPDNLHENYEGYNVTAQVVFNASTPEDENDSSSVGGGSSSSVLTSSSKLPSNSSSSNNSTYQPLRIRAR